jgi:hypothetical protein
VPINIKDISTEFLAKLLGWVYIFAFVFILGCYIYGLFGVIDQMSFTYDEDKLTSIVWIRCAIEKYIVQKGKLPNSLYNDELRVGSTNAPAGWFADQEGIAYRIIESPSEKNELICPEFNSDCEKLITDNNFFLYELCTNFKMDFGDEERAFVHIPNATGFDTGAYCGGNKSYHVNPKHLKGKYCYIFYSPKEKGNYPFFINKLNSYDDFYDKYSTDN